MASARANAANAIARNKFLLLINPDCRMLIIYSDQNLGYQPAYTPRLTVKTYDILCYQHQQLESG